MEALPGLADVPLAGLGKTVWGIDPSTQRMSVAARTPGGGLKVATLSLPRGPEHRRLGEAWGELVPFLSAFAGGHGAPALVFVEKPFGGSSTKRKVHPASHRVIGVLLGAVGVVAPRSEVEFVGPGTWKAMAMGQGRGFAKKPEIVAWARSIGYGGTLEDEADAVGLATAAACRLLDTSVR